jgi:hypothetical protein
LSSSPLLSLPLSSSSSASPAPLLSLSLSLSLLLSLFVSSSRSILPSRRRSSFFFSIGVPFTVLVSGFWGLLPSFRGFGLKDWQKENEKKRGARA